MGKKTCKNAFPWEMFCVLKEKTDYYPFTLRSLVSKILAKLARNRVIDQLKKCGLFPDFHFGFRYSQSTADLLAVVSYRITYNRYGTIPSVTLDISKAFDRVQHGGLLNKPKSYEISAKVFGFYLSFLCNRWLQVVPDGKFLQEYQFNDRVSRGSILGSFFSLIH